MSDPTGRAHVPPPLTVAASLVAVQALVLIGVAVVELFEVSGDRVTLGVTMAVFYTLYGAVLAAAALALWRLQGWARGPVLITQLIQVGLAWNIRDYPLPAIALAVTALIAIAGTVHPDSIKALDGADGAGD